MEKNSCRMCKSTRLKEIVDLGSCALADNFLTESQLKENEGKYPLNVNLCQDCGLTQLGYVVPKELMFNRDYPYDSSTTTSGSNHFISMGRRLASRFGLKSDSLVIDIGSNTGVLLSGFVQSGCKVLGVEPSSKIAEIAQNNGIKTIVAFFSADLAQKISKEFGKASIITLTNVFAHIDDLHDFMRGADVLLTEQGIIVIEAPYLFDLISNLEYDTIYHEHLSYLSLKPLDKFFTMFDFEIFDLEKQNIHGGTMRYFVGRKGTRPINKIVNETIEIENTLYKQDNFLKFSARVTNHAGRLLAMIKELREEGRRIVGLSAPAKGNTLLCFSKIDSDLLDYITEKNPLKIGKFTPGTHIPIYSDAVLVKDKPDYALILAWNFAEEIMQNNSEFRNNGGKFIIPIPEPRII